MSRLGRKPIDIPDGVKVALTEATITIENAKDAAKKLAYKVISPIKVEIDNSAKKISVKNPASAADKKANSLHGLTRTLIANMIEGVSKGYQKELQISGVGYNAKLQGKELLMNLGYSHPVVMPIPSGLAVECPSQTSIVVKGIDKQLVGEFAAEIRRKREVEPYNLKGIKYKDEVVKKKAGKTFVSGAT